MQTYLFIYESITTGDKNCIVLVLQYYKIINALILQDNEYKM